MDLRGRLPPPAPEGHIGSVEHGAALCGVETDNENENERPGLYAEPLKQPSPKSLNPGLLGRRTLANAPRAGGLQERLFLQSRR